jgi:hypothetical protein
VQKHPQHTFNIKNTATNEYYSSLIKEAYDQSKEPEVARINQITMAYILGASRFIIISKNVFLILSTV